MATTAALYAGAAASVALTWTSTANATGSGTGTYATWVGTTANAAPVIELSGYGAQAVVPAGSVINSVTVTVRHLVSSTTVWPTENAQLYVGTTAKGSLTALTRTTAAHEDSFQVVGLTYADLSDLRVRYAPVHSATATSGTASLDRIGIVVDYTLPTVFDLYPSRADPGVGFGGTGFTLGTDFQVSQACWLTGFLFWAQPAAGSGLFCRLWDMSTGDVLAGAAIPNLPVAANAWQVADAALPVPLATGRTYVVGTYLPNGGPLGGSAGPTGNGPIISSTARSQTGDKMPTSQNVSGNYGHSPIVTTVDPGPIVGPGRRLLAT